MVGAGEFQGRTLGPAEGAEGDDEGQGLAGREMESAHEDGAGWDERCLEELTEVGEGIRIPTLGRTVSSLGARLVRTRLDPILSPPWRRTRRAEAVYLLSRLIILRLRHC